MKKANENSKKKKEKEFKESGKLNSNKDSHKNNSK